MGSKLSMEDAVIGTFDGKEEPWRITVEANNLCLTTEDSILHEIREICKGLALSDRARAARYDKIVEVLNGRD